MCALRVNVKKTHVQFAFIARRTCRQMCHGRCGLRLTQTPPSTGQATRGARWPCARATYELGADAWHLVANAPYTLT
jgi:hypothetical protein